MSLYNELRPTTFKEVVGQKNIVNQLKGLLEAGITAPLLLIGPRGVGKTTVARITAKKVNCESEGVEPCNTCAACKDIANNSSLDVIELDAASNNKVEDIRKIIDTCMYTPVYKKKVYILDEVHMLSKAAFNCLLKTLEEPPANCIFILCTTEEEAIPATILSRCTKFYFEQLDLTEITTYLEEVCTNRHVAYELSALQMIARSSEGCMRDALSILEIFLLNENLTADEVSKSLGIETEDIVLQIISGILLADLPMALDAFHNSVRKGRSTASLIKSLIATCCDAVYVQKGEFLAMHTKTYVEKVKSINELADTQTLMHLAKVFSELLPTVSKTGKGNFAVEAAIIRSMNTLVESKNLLGRIEQLEKKIASLEAGNVPVASIATAQKETDFVYQGKTVTETSDVINSSELFNCKEENTAADEEKPMTVSEKTSDTAIGLPLEEEPLPDFLPNDTHVSTESVNDTEQETSSPVEDSMVITDVPNGNTAPVTNEPPFKLPEDIHLTEGVHITDSISLKELSDNCKEKTAETPENEPMDIFSIFGEFARQ